MTCSQCRGIELQFDEAVARRELRRYLRRGPPGSTRRLLAQIGAHGVEGATFVDVGGGIGAVQHELIAAGAAGGTNAEASPAYLSVARAEARTRGYADRVTYLEGDFVEIADTVEPADIVTLDRVLCCYPDMDALVDATAPRARRVYGLVFPRERALLRLVARVVNLVQRLRRHPFRVYLHDTERVVARARAHGLAPASHERRLIWQVLTFTRPTPSPAPGD